MTKMRTYKNNIIAPVSFDGGKWCAYSFEHKWKTEVEYDVVQDIDEW